MKHFVNTLTELDNKVIELVHNGYKQTDITEHEIVFTKGLHAKDVIIPTWWPSNNETQIPDFDDYAPTFNDYVDDYDELICDNIDQEPLTEEEIQNWLEHVASIPMSESKLPF